jgi:hypothetical protein
MQWKTDRNFGTRREARRLACDFSAAANFADQPVAIRQVLRPGTVTGPGNFRFRPRNLSRAATAKTLIRSGWIEDMRGALSKIEGRRHDFQMRRPDRMSRRTPQSRRADFRGGPRGSAGFASDFFLFYLTAAAIFDNRHGLLKKCDRARTARTLSAVEPQL